MILKRNINIFYKQFSITVALNSAKHFSTLPPLVSHSQIEFLVCLFVPNCAFNHKLLVVCQQEESLCFFPPTKGLLRLLCLCVSVYLCVCTCTVYVRQNLLCVCMKIVPHTHRHSGPLCCCLFIEFMGGTCDWPFHLVVSGQMSRDTITFSSVHCSLDILPL